MKSFLIIFMKAVVAIFAIVGVLFTGVFVAMQFGLLNVRGSIADRNGFFFDSATSTLPNVPCDDDTQKSARGTRHPSGMLLKKASPKTKLLSPA